MENPFKVGDHAITVFNNGNDTEYEVLEVNGELIRLDMEKSASGGWYHYGWWKRILSSNEEKLNKQVIQNG